MDEEGIEKDTMVMSDGAAVASGSSLVDDAALAEELQLQEVILFSAFQEMAIEDESVDSLLDDLIRRDHREASERPSTTADPGPSSSSAAISADPGPSSSAAISADPGASSSAAVSADPGPSSSAISPTGDEFYCAICMEDMPGDSKFTVSSCRHAFCLSCMGEYIAGRISENIVHVRCPGDGCRDGTVEPEHCRGIVPSGLLDRWGLALCDSALGEQRLYCPFRDCSAALLAEDGGGGEEEEGGGGIAEAECPHCHRLFCARCVVPWHAGVGCEEFQELGEDERGREDMMVRQLAGEQRWQRCPQCRMYVEKSDGCMFMKCRCGFCFCYSCASPMSKDLHYCQQCKR